MSDTAGDKSTLTASGFSGFLQPRMISFLGVILLVFLGWAYLSLMVVQMIPLMDMQKAGPGMGWFNQFSQWADLDDFGRAVLASICGPGIAGVTGANLGFVDSVGFLSVMWVAMAMAMMVPTAMPMISAYIEICETAAAKSIATVSSFVLIAGYVLVWFVFAISAAVLQTVMTWLALLSPEMLATHQGVSGAILIGAGLYQFSALKQACLHKCRTPFSFFFANWSVETRDIFKLGLQQGLNCLGCCWALMLVMFVTGVMNVIWMVLLTVLMMAEKMIDKPDLLRKATGFGLIGWGVALISLILFG